MVRQTTNRRLISQGSSSARVTQVPVELSSMISLSVDNLPRARNASSSAGSRDRSKERPYTYTFLNSAHRSNLCGSNSTSSRLRRGSSTPSRRNRRARSVSPAYRSGQKMWDHWLLRLTLLVEGMYFKLYKKLPLWSLRLAISRHNAQERRLSRVVEDGDKQRALNLSFPPRPGRQYLHRVVKPQCRKMKVYILYGRSFLLIPLKQQFEAFVEIL